MGKTKAKEKRTPRGAVKISEAHHSKIAEASEITGIRISSLVEQGIDMRLEEDDIEQARRRAGRLA